MSKPFTWIPIDQELATELAKWQVRQAELIQFLEDLRKKDYVITPLTDKDKDGAIFLYEEIDPFTFFGVFNRGIRQDQRVSILVEVKKFFNNWMSREYIPDHRNPILELDFADITVREGRFPAVSGFVMGCSYPI